LLLDGLEREASVLCETTGAHLFVIVVARHRENRIIRIRPHKIRRLAAKALLTYIIKLARIKIIDI
jgi:hypothetical protein